MIISKDVDALRNSISEIQQADPNKTIGFVPTMGALHEGHLSLVEKAAEQADIVVVSIFVNPTQFNDKSDLQKYPRTLEADIAKLKNTSCDILFAPSEKDVYPEGNQAYKIDLNGLDKVMEGAFRDNHFEGVCMVVERLFDLVRPNKAFFGLKDFQQLAIIRHMVDVRNINIEIVQVPIVRAESGLALSSRNERLTAEQKEEARCIYTTLQHGKELIAQYDSAKNLRKHLVEYFNRNDLKLEYLEIVDNQTLQAVEKIQPNITCCIAAYCGEVRLIDNMQYL